MQKPHNVKFNNGHLSDDTPKGRIVPAGVVGHHDNGNLDLHAAEGDGDAVKLYENVPEGTGGLTFQRV